MKKTSSISLIGMPGSGKSTLGKLLANTLKLKFIDTDQLIEARANQSLQSLVNEQGYEVLRQLEEDVLLNTEFGAAVIATGGSAVYSKKAMNRLKTLGPCVYLEVSFRNMSRRIGSAVNRGLAISNDMSLDSMYKEREPMYKYFADNLLDTDAAKKARLVLNLEDIYHQAPNPTATHYK
ncbi:MAG: shikimate kinase [Flavobacteriales bacterium]|jgi:shikimate kinase